MAFRGERWTLDQFIETTVTLDNLIRTQELCHNPALERFCPVQEELEPIQLGHGRLTSAECERRLQGQLCLYCGDPEYRHLQCPVCPKDKVSGTLVCNHLTVPIVLSWGLGKVEAHALVDSGAAGCFIDSSFVRIHNIFIQQCKMHLKVSALNGQPLGRGFVDSQTKPVLVCGGLSPGDLAVFFDHLT
ncbi:hypothetical protein Z043_119186 [Scleropages formosus]|uniref:Uncharacterized protein n=1 Tax=Scleropages formosus TaxID=113540 RepID=A0A0P7WGK1_SCLFO|nr:hypothetical protein Z043_119186 [Scleropages formosus]